MDGRLRFCQRASHRGREKPVNLACGRVTSGSAWRSEAIAFCGIHQSKRLSNPREDIMAEAQVSVTKFESKSHNSPDEVRSPSKTRVEVVRLPGYTMGRLNFDPGWKWSECIKPVVGTNSCQVSHVG